MNSRRILAFIVLCSLVAGTPTQAQGPLLGQAPAACTGQVPDQERVALIGLYTSTGGMSWANRTGWLGADLPPCSWYGIRCGCDLTTGSYVTTIDLEYNNLTGAIPLELVNFHRLSGLVLSGNNLTGSIAAELGSLDQLAVLFLDSNKLTGQVPQTILDLPHLRTLNLGWNDLSGNLPVPTYGGLERLYLSANHFTGNVPPFGYGQRSLVQLWLSDNNLTGPIPASLGAQADLEDLLLDGNALTGTIPSELGNLKNLRNLYLSRDHLTGPIPPELGSLPALKQLRLDNNQLSGPIPATLGGLANLRDLTLESNRLSGEVPSELGQLRNLWWLTFDWNADLAGLLPYGLMNDANLRWLSYSDTQLCASGDAPFQEWLDGLVARGAAKTSGLTCTGAQVSGAIPPGGGALTSPGDRTVYTFGPGAFGSMASGGGETGISATAIVTHTPQAPAAAPSAGMLRGIGHFFDVAASVNGQPAAPARPYTLTVTFGLNQVQTVLSETLGLYWWDGAAWRREPGGAVNVTAHTVTAHPSHLSLWAVLGVSKYREFLPLLRK